LIKNHLYSYGPHLEKIFHALLLTDVAYQGEEMDASLLRVSRLIPRKIANEFIRIRHEEKVLKLDRISDGMEDVFCDENGDLRMEKIYKFMPNLKELHLWESHDVDNEFVSNLIEYLNGDEGKKLHTIKAFKYNFKGSSEQFQFAAGISVKNQTKLLELGWVMREVYEENCYKFILKKNK